MRMQVPLGKQPPWVLPVTVVCLALGALVAFMINSSNEPIDVSAMRPDHLALLYAQAERENNMQQDEIFKLRAQLDELMNAAVGEQQLKKAWQKDMNDLRVRAGATAVEGKGIVITIDDTDVMKPNPADVNANALLTHDLDLLMLVNELRSAGAEAMDINGQRVIGSTAIRCVGPVIYVNSRPVSVPFVVRAIGNPDTLYGAVNLPYGVLDQLKPLGIRVEVAKRDKIRVPAARVLPPLEVGTPVPDAESGTTQQ